MTGQPQRSRRSVSRQGSPTFETAAHALVQEITWGISREEYAALPERLRQKYQAAHDAWHREHMERDSC